MNRPSELPDSQNLPFIEALLGDFQRDPRSVPEDWRRLLERQTSNGPAQIGPTFRPRSIFNPAGGNGHDAADDATLATAMQDRVDQMVRAYRVRGHMIAAIDPLLMPRPATPELDPSYYGFTDADMERPFSSRTIKGPPVRTLHDIVERLQNTYCRFIGVQYMHIDELEVRHWLQERMEGDENRCELTRTEQFRILTRLTDATIFEEFIQKKFIGAKSFSLEGSESLIPLLDLAIEGAAAQGVDEVVLGMAHRGRLNVLANIMGKSPRLIFREFEDLDAEKNLGRGDVKYHLGYHCDWMTAARRSVHLALCFNPSHLEFVNPVALGRLRAKQDRQGDLNHERSMCIQIHGDAAFAGEGIVQETLNLSELPGYRAGGSLHVIVNNQVGFTTSPSEGRSGIYASAIGKMLQIPIFHVNGEDPESVAQVVRLALDFRRQFRRDVIIDMYCYRKRGHNESDNPDFTQPVMYDAIRRRRGVREGYLEHLAQLGDVTREAADEIETRLREHLEGELSGMREPAPPSTRPSVLGRIWSAYRGGPDASVEDVDTGVDKQRLAELLEKTTRLPEDFVAHKTIKRVLEMRRDMARGRRRLDWAAAEALAFATLATEGARVRLSGQDCGRGTFSQRHAVLHDQDDGRAHTPLAHLSAGQAPVEIFNSPLSEAGVVGFEYGYAIACPDGLTLWEAQFGDFVNAAQVIIDQFIASAEDKWHSLNGLVLLLPHGFEGQGPEHSSARMERFLSLTAEDNIQVVYPSSPAQYFHVLRRQVARPWRKPLVVMTPKSLLRLDRATSTLDELAAGRFQRIIPDDGGVNPREASRVLLCSGKIFYDLQKEREERERGDVAIVRFEQLYPLSDAAIVEALKPYPKKTPVLWTQEEPQNMGAWPYLRYRFGDKLPDRRPLAVLARRASASPATGSHGSHKIEQRHILDKAFADA